MAKTIDHFTIRRAIKALSSEYAYSIGISNLFVQKDLQISCLESLEDECFDVSVDENAPDDYKKNLPLEFNGYRVFYRFGPKAEPL